MVFHVVFIDMFAQQQIAKAKPFFSLLHRSTTNPHHSVFSTYRRHQLHGRRFFKRSARCRRQQREALLRSGQIKKPASIAHTALWAVPALAGPPPAASAIAGHSNKDIAAVKAAFSFSKFAPGERLACAAAAFLPCATEWSSDGSGQHQAMVRCLTLWPKVISNISHCEKEEHEQCAVDDPEFVPFFSNGSNAPPNNEKSTDALLKGPENVKPIFYV